MALHTSVLAHQQRKVNNAPIDFDLIHGSDRYLVSVVSERSHGLLVCPAHPVLDLWEAGDGLEKRCFRRIGLSLFAPHAVLQTARVVYVYPNQRPRYDSVRVVPFASSISHAANCRTCGLAAPC